LVNVPQLARAHASKLTVRGHKATPCPEKIAFKQDSMYERNCERTEVPAAQLPVMTGHRFYTSTTRQPQAEKPLHSCNSDIYLNLQQITW
jgi:hypothetical protein